MDSPVTFGQTLEFLIESGVIHNSSLSRTLKSGEIIFHPQDAASSFFCVKTGQIKLVYYADDGQIAHQGSIRSGQCFGELALMHGTHRSAAIATQTSQLFEIPNKAFLETLHQNADLAMLVITELVERLQSTRTLLGLRCLNSARTRLLEYLRTLKTSDGNTYQLDISFREVAEQLSLSPEALSRTLRDLQTEGIINRHSRTITFL